VFHNDVAGTNNETAQHSRPVRPTTRRKGNAMTWDSAATMRAVVADDYGPPDRFAVRRLPVPSPGFGQVQVRIEAAALNPLDLQFASGLLRRRAPLAFPHALGIDFAGTVTDLGADVDRFTVGAPVFGLAFPTATADVVARVVTPITLGTGTLAEYAVFEADTPALEIRPDGLAADQAAALPMAGLAAMTVLRSKEFQPGEKVLVVGATGGVGSIVVALLAAAGVEVIATATADDEKFVRTAGATDVIDYRETDTAQETLRRYPGGVDTVVATAMGDQLADIALALRPGGRLLSTAFGSPRSIDAITRNDIMAQVVYSAGQPDDLAELANRSLRGDLPTIVGRSYRLDDGVRAYTDLITEHTTGKFVVLPD
jgi:NADPH:quinone reductase